MKNPMQMRQIAIDRTPVERRLMRRLRHAPLGECLTFEQFLEVAKRGQRAAGYYEQMTHIISCPACRRAYLELRVILQAQRPSLARWLSRLTTPRLPQWALATGFAGVVFAFAVWSFYPKQDKDTLIAANPSTPKHNQVAQLPPSSTSNQQDGQPEVNRQQRDNNNQQDGQPEVNRQQRDNNNQQDGQPEVNRQQRDNNNQQDGQPEVNRQQRDNNNQQDGQPEVNRQQRDNNNQQGSPLEREIQLAGNLLSQGAESLSRTLASLAQGRAVRGGRSARGVQQIPVLRPDLSETALLEETTVTLQWESVEGATRYMVVLRRRDTGETLLEEELPETQTLFQLRSLASGGEYELILSAPRGERATLKTEIRFQVMSDAQQAQLRWARQNASEAPLVAGLLLYQLERYREAVDALQRAQQKYPNNEEIKSALNNLRARTRR